MAASFEETISELVNDFHAGAPAEECLEKICSLIASLESVCGVTITRNSLSRHGTEQQPIAAVGNDTGLLPLARASTFRSEDITYQDKVLGTLALHTTAPLSEAAAAKVSLCSRLAGVVLALTRQQNDIYSFEQRLEVLNELNQLITANLTMERTIKTLARGAAFRFTSDTTLVLLVAPTGDCVELKGAYGIDTTNFPIALPLRDTLLGKVHRLGGIISVNDLKATSSHGFEFLAGSGISSVHIASIETRGNTLGALLIGYEKPTLLDDRTSLMFEEYARGAAVAIANAMSQVRLAEYTEQLEELVKSRTADLAVQTQRAEEASRAKSAFVANMSHELRSPLTAVVAYSSVMLDGIFGPINDKQKDALESIARSAQHLKELIDDVLDISKVEAGKSDPVPEQVEIKQLLTQAFKLMYQTAMSKNIKLHPPKLSEEMNHVRAYADPRHVRQVIINLLSNAIKYTPEGGEVSFGAQVVADKIKLSIVDTGVGINEESRQRLFERYERVDDDYSRKQVGTGLGLSLTKHLVEINGGTIGVESEPGVGSTFWITLPAASIDLAVSNTVDATVAKKRFSARLDGLNVLVVEDNAATCDVLDTLITAVGGHAVVVQSVAEARPVVETQSLDVALVDLAMPGESGIRLIEYIHKHPTDSIAKLPIIVVSGCVFEKDRAQALAAGASQFIAKPFKPSDLVETIRAVTTAAILNS